MSQTQNNLKNESSQTDRSSSWSKLQNDPISIVPKRVIQMALVVTFLIVAISLFLRWPLTKLLMGYWIGVMVNLLNFRLIVIGTRNFLDNKEKGLKASVTGGYFARQAIAGGALIGTAFFLGVFAFLATVIGLSMVKFVIQMDGFFSYKMKNTK